MGSPELTTCGGIFSKKNAETLGYVAMNIRTNFDLHGELIGIMNAIEIASIKGYNQLWLESNSKLVTLAFKSQSIVP